MKSWNPLPLLLAVLFASLMLAMAPTIADAAPPNVQRTSTIYPTVDITIKSNASTNSNGSLNPLWGSTSQQKVLIKFSTDQIPTGIVSATLSLRSFSTTGSYSSCDLWVCGSGFTNSTNYTTGNSLITTTAAGTRAGIVGDWLTYNLTNHGGSYALVMNASNKNLGLSSSEYSGTTSDPRIDYVYNSPAMPGDANLDGVFTSADLVLVWQAGLYEGGPGPAVGWSTGDWNEDGVFDSSDMVLAFQVGGYEGGTQAAIDYWESLTE